MKNILLGTSKVSASRIALGCMRINALNLNEVDNLVHTAIESGINFFDHADIYGGGECEKLFGDVLNNNKGLREKIILQSKCGIRKGMFDFSKEHILNSVDNALERLQTPYLDFLLLHRPDALVEPQEVAEAFDQLEKSGKVKHFGVSNQKPMQIELLQKYCTQKIEVNQLQFSITNAKMISNGINVNMENSPSVDHDGSILDYCRLKDITIQPWSPFQYGFFEGVFLGNEKFPELNATIDKLSDKYNVTNSAIAIAWILRHPAGMQPILGTTNAKRVSEIAKADNITLTREEWYEIYRAAGNILP